MTYPPQDPAGQPGQYGPSQPGAQPPAGGYAPGQVGGESYPTTHLPSQQQYPGQAPQQYPGQAPQYDPAAGYQAQYPQYGAPPVQPNTKSSSSTILLVIGVVVLMAIGAFGGYYFLGDDEDATLADDDATVQDTPGGGEGEDETGGDQESEAPPAPSGTHLEVASLGSVTPIPGAEWQPAAGPGVASEPLADAELYQVNHTETWVSIFGVGLFSGAAAVFDPADLNASALSASEVWLGDGFSTVEGYQQSELTYTPVEVDGRPGVLAEWRNSWTASPDTTDLYEDTALLVVDVDGVNGFIGVASVSESGAALYDPAIEALLATDFDAEAA
ncbi:MULTISPECIES: hypothetical protein [Glycomyces]|uniref:Uncharacterized protein n=2 Tax=Glycomyces TaxID=58113 RepID=A0A9X3PQQ5_9ACTN|nr:hypothetical protein [Glycomyces lechevalierae]MDA1388083.1 hypothetical protein [Glycomyces lechevalierae]MDR7338744.1 hypothetical protein [Glycomyces lechevalierae]